MRFESTADVEAPTGKIWALIDRLEDWPKWMPSIKSIKRVSLAPLAVGSQLSVTANVSGIRVTLLMTITEFALERNVVMEGRALGTRLRRFYRIEPLSGKTRITVGGDVSGVLAPLARRGGKRVSDEIVLAVKKKVEASGQ
jgi:carbon monoxide dehydrogenase subunit G